MRAIQAVASGSAAEEPSAALGGRTLRAYVNKLINTLNSDPDSGTCDAFIHAMQTVRDVYNTPWYDHSKDPTKGALNYVRMV